jgi:Phage integrase family
MSELLLDRAGRRRSPATMPGFHAGRPPHNKGLRYPADPPKVEEIIAVMRAAGDRAHGRRLRALIVLLWRAGLRIHEALALTEGDLDRRRGSLLIRHGKGGRRREVGLDAWGWEELRPWLELRPELPVGAVRHQWHDVRRPLVARCGTRGAAAHGRRGRCSAPLRAAPTAPRPRRRNGPRRRAADRDPAPTRSQQPRDHLGLPAGHRQRRDHRDGARTTSADDSGQRVRATLTTGQARHRSSRRAALERRRLLCIDRSSRGSARAECRSTSAVRRIFFRLLRGLTCANSRH